MRRFLVIASDALIIWIGAALAAVLYIGFLFDSGLGIDSLDRVEPISWLMVGVQLPRGGIVAWLRRSR